MELNTKKWYNFLHEHTTNSPNKFPGNFFTCIPKPLELETVGKPDLGFTQSPLHNFQDCRLGCRDRATL